MTLPNFLNSMWAKVAILVIYFLLSTFGLYHLKSAQFFSFAFIGGFISYVLGFGLWMLVLRLLPLSIAFPVAAGGLIITTQVAGYYFLNEKIALPQWIGLGLMFIAIGLIYQSSTT